MKKLSLIIALCAFVFPFVSSASFDTSLKYGAKGQSVVELQDFLIDQNFLTGSSTGNFFSLTLKAVKSWQTANNLPATGFFGPLSRIKATSLLSLSDSDTAEQAETGSVASPVIDPTTQEKIDALTKKVQDLTQAQQQIVQSTQKIADNTTPAVIQSAPSYVITTKRPLVLNPKNPLLRSFPITLDNTSNAKVTLKSVDYQVFGIGLSNKAHTNVASQFDMANGVAVENGITIHFVLFNSLEILPKQSTTFYVNVWDIDSLNVVNISLKDLSSAENAIFNF